MSDYTNDCSTPTFKVHREGTFTIVLPHTKSNFEVHHKKLKDDWVGGQQCTAQPLQFFKLIINGHATMVNYTQPKFEVCLIVVVLRIEYEFHKVLRAKLKNADWKFATFLVVMGHNSIKVTESLPKFELCFRVLILGIMRVS